MALYHHATLTPTKAEMLADWVPTQPWCPSPDAPVEVIGAFRFDDPEGKVGMETHLVDSGGVTVHVPLTYRDAPADNGATLIGEMQHSALGTRWVYDGLTDDRYLMMAAAVAMTGQGEALGLVVYEGRWRIAPSHVRIKGGGWTQERIEVDGFAPTTTPATTPTATSTADSTTTVDSISPTFANDRFELIVHRRPVIGQQPLMGLTATWDGQSSPVVLCEVRQHH